MTPSRGRARAPKPTSAGRDAHAEIHIMNVGELQAGSAREWQVGSASCEAAVVGVCTMIARVWAMMRRIPHLLRRAAVTQPADLHVMVFQSHIAAFVAA